MKALLRILFGVLALLAATEVHAMRWYSPNTGRWFSRDPVGEQAFVVFRSERRLGENRHLLQLAQNPDYTFNKNDPLGRLDPYGLWPWSRFEEESNADGSTTITVKEKCTIVVLFGHGTRSAPHSFVFNAICTAGAFVGCDAGTTNKRIPAENSIPGAKLTDGVIYAGIPAQNHPKEERFDYWIGEARGGARTLAQSFCKKAKCCCKEVVIYGELAGSHYWPPDNWPQPDNWNETVKCNKVK